MLYSKIHQYIYLFNKLWKLYLQYLNKYNANIALKYANKQ